MQRITNVDLLHYIISAIVGVVVCTCYPATLEAEFSVAGSRYMARVRTFIPVQAEVPE